MKRKIDLGDMDPKFKNAAAAGPPVINPYVLIIN